MEEWFETLTLTRVLGTAHVTLAGSRGKPGKTESRRSLMRRLILEHCRGEAFGDYVFADRHTISCAGGENAYHYSLSYSGAFGAAAVSKRHAVGIDIEDERRVEKNADAVSYAFPRDSQQVVESLSAAERWTLHEAVVKLERRGLDSEVALLEANGGTLLYRIDKGLDVKRACFAFFDVKPYVLAICTNGTVERTNEHGTGKNTA